MKILIQHLQKLERQPDKSSKRENDSYSGLYACTEWRKRYTDLCSRLVWSHNSRLHTQYTWHRQRQVCNDNVRSPDDNWCCRCVHSHMGCNQRPHCNSPPATHQFTSTVAHSLARLTSPLEIHAPCTPFKAPTCPSVIGTFSGSLWKFRPDAISQHSAHLYLDGLEPAVSLRYDTRWYIVHSKADETASLI